MRLPGKASSLKLLNWVEYWSRIPWGVSSSVSFPFFRKGTKTEEQRTDMTPEIAEEVKELTGVKTISDPTYLRLV
jgi:hypothetical protein